MQKKVGMITIYRKNYGAFLQAYALQQTLLAEGFQPEIIRYDYYRDHTILGINLDHLKNPLRFCKMLAIELLRHRAHRQKEKVFEKSIEKHIFESKEYYKNYKALQKNPPQYDLYTTGSDQVFNLKISPQALDARLLKFVRSGKKMSYAASAGRAGIPEAAKERFQNALKSFDIISVRESGLRDYIEQEYGLPALQNVDPTLLLSKGKWESFGEVSSDVEDKDYIFYYRVLKQDEVEAKVRYVSEKLGLPIYVADGNDQFPHQIKRTKDLSPEEWVGTMAKAKYVVTNSFHGTAFSINLAKRVSIVVPPNGGDRITDLLEKCALTTEAQKDIMPECVDEIYENAKQYLNGEYQKACALFKEI